MHLKALIFDVDGTLANTERYGHLRAFNLAFSQFKLDWVWSGDLYHKLLKITGGQLRLKHYLKEYKPEFQHPDLDGFVAEIHALKSKIYRRLINQGAVPLRLGVARLFGEAKAAGLRLAIATTTTRANVDALLINTLGRESLDWFELIAAGDCVPNLKPAGDIYHYVLDKMNLKPQQAIAFEDSDNGIRAATKAHLKTLITVNEYTKTHNFDNAMVVLNHLGEADKPFTVLRGEVSRASYVSVDYLRALHAKYC